MFKICLCITGCSSCRGLWRGCSRTSQVSYIVITKNFKVTKDVTTVLCFISSFQKPHNIKKLNWYQPYVGKQEWHQPWVKCREMWAMAHLRFQPCMGCRATPDIIWEDSRFCDASGTHRCGSYCKILQTSHESSMKQYVKL